MDLTEPESNETEVLDIHLQVNRMQLDVVVMALIAAQKRSDDRLARLLVEQKISKALADESALALRQTCKEIMDQIQEQAPWILARIDQIEMRMRDFVNGRADINDLP